MKTDADGLSIPGTIRNLPAVLRSAGILLLHIIVFTGSAIFIFNRKDVLS
jgi:ABC-2 type transport system permease protein